MIALAKDEGVEESAARVLGQHRALSLEALDRLIALLRDERWDVSKSAAEALNKRPVWECYRLLSTQAPLLLEGLYRYCLIKRNFQQIVPLYIEGDTLYFSTSTELQSVSLTEKAAFRQAIWNAQDAVGIPSASRVKLIPSTALEQDSAVSPASSSQSIASMQEDTISLASSSSHTFFLGFRGSHDNTLDRFLDRLDRLVRRVGRN